MPIDIRAATVADAQGCGRICFESFGAIADRHGFPRDFPSVQEATDLAVRLTTHAGFFGVVAERDGTLVGSNFLDERSTIFSVGPITVDPAAQDGRIGRALMAAVLEECATRRAPGVRLLQVAYNNRSMSLYTKLGFQTREPLAAIQGDPLLLRIDGFEVRDALEADLDECSGLCTRVHGHDRSGELRDAIAHGTAKVVERDGRITGYTTGVGFIGHSVALSNDDLQALIANADEFLFSGFLLSLRNAELMRWCFEHGLRIVYMLNLMTLGFYQEPRGAFLTSIGF